MNAPIQALIARISGQADGALITGSENLRYLSGFTGSSGMLLLHPEVKYLITDFRYIEQGKAQCPGYTVVDAPGLKARTFLKEICDTLSIRRLWFEDSALTVFKHRELTEALPETAWVPDNGQTALLRQLKAPREAEAIRQAAALADEGFAHLLEFVRPGITEADVSLELEFYLRRKGSEGIAFPIIAASGENGAMPHAAPGCRVLKRGDFVTFDFGCIVDGYASDMTRTLSLGPPSDTLKEIYQVTLTAQQAALDGLKPGITGAEADKLARDVIASAGYGEYFGHGLGHGVGLHIHEGPTLSPRSVELLEACMTVTVEPGIYLPGIGGVRIEDLVLLTAFGYENFTHSSKELIIL